MNIAIIGANGFIGKHLTEAFTKTPDNKLFLFGKGDPNHSNKNIPYYDIDIRQPEKWLHHFEKIDLVYYLVSLSIPSSTWDKPVTEIEMNLIPFVNFIEHISKLQVKKIVFISSAGTVYGPTHEKVNEESNKNPFSPYGITKLTMEYFLNYFKKKNGLNFDIYRVSNVYGFGQDTSKGLGIINTFLEKIIRERVIHVFGDGQHIRNYIYIKDVAQILCLSSTTPFNASHVYNLSSDDSLSIMELVYILKKVVSEKFDIEYKELRGSDNSAILLDNAKLKKALPNYKLTEIEKGITETYLQIKANATY